VEQHRRVVDDQILIEAEPNLARQLRRRVDAENAGGDLGDVRAGLRVRDHERSPLVDVCKRMEV
jgi:hypothetical protein